MSVLGIDEITYSADDLPTCKRFFTDWGLTLIDESADQLVFETLNGGRVIVAASTRAGLPPALEQGPTLRQVVWGVESAADLERFAARIGTAPGFAREGSRLGCTDPNGLSVRFQVTKKLAPGTRDAGSSPKPGD